MGVVNYQAVSTSFFGAGARSALITHLPPLGVTRALIITDHFLFEQGVAKTIGDLLIESNIEYAIYYNVQANPTIAIVNECVAAAKALQVDCLVAVGGGSAIDTAKAVSILLQNGGQLADYEGVNQSRTSGMPVIAISTTSGTASEVTTFYIITDESTHRKLCMIDENCKVTIAINDTDLIKGMPKGLTAATGMDAMTHAIEAALCRVANPLTDKDAHWAISTIQTYLPRAIGDGDDMQAREMMAYAQYVAGMAFSNSGLGMVHAMAHSLGGMFNLPHGMCNAILLPFVMAYNGANGQVDEQFKKIAMSLYLADADSLSVDETIKQSVQAIKRLLTQTGIHQTLKMLQVDPAQFETMAEMALLDSCMTANPCTPTKEDIINIFKQAYQGF